MTLEVGYGATLKPSTKTAHETGVCSLVHRQLCMKSNNENVTANNFKATCAFKIIAGCCGILE